MWALHVLVVGLALHNFVMAELWDAGLHGRLLELVSAWKEVLLAACIVAVWWRGWRTFRPRWCDWLAFAYAEVVVVWAVLPQSWLGGSATHHGVLLGVRHDLVPAAAYFFGRGLALSEPELRRIGATILATALGVAAFGLVDIYAIPLSWWRGSGRQDGFTTSSGSTISGSQICRRTSSTTPGTSIRSDGSSRRSSRRSRARTCSWSRCCSPRRG